MYQYEPTYKGKPFNDIPNWLQVVMAIVLVIVIGLFAWFGYNLFDNNPKYDEQMSGLEDPYWAP